MARDVIEREFEAWWEHEQGEDSAGVFRAGFLAARKRAVEMLRAEADRMMEAANPSPSLRNETLEYRARVVSACAAALERMGEEQDA